MRNSMEIAGTGLGEKTVPRILLVEDNDLNRDMLSRRLAKKGYEIVLAVDGPEGLEMAKSSRPDLILLDLSLPVMDGWDVIRHLKADASTERIPVIALTAHALVTDRQRALEAGFDEYDSKPVEMQRLLEKINSQLARVSAP